MHVRPARPSDAEAIAGVHVRSWQHAYKDILPAEFLASLSVADRTRMWTDAIEEKTQRIRVVDVAGRLAGFASFGLSRDEGATATDFELWAIYVDPPVIGSGAGYALWTQCFAEMRLAGATRVMLWAMAKNTFAIQFYRAAGFSEEEGSRKSFELGGVQVDEVRLAQKIRR